MRLMGGATVEAGNALCDMGCSAPCAMPAAVSSGRGGPANRMDEVSTPAGKGVNGTAFCAK